MSRLESLFLALALTRFVVPPAQAAELTPDAAYTLVARDVWSKVPLPQPEELATARKILEAQAKREPKAARVGAPPFVTISSGRRKRHGATTKSTRAASPTTTRRRKRRPR